MKMKQCNKKAVAWGLTAAMCISSLFTSGQPAVVKAEETDAGESAVTLSNPVIEAEKGHVQWDCIYFGNYWQKKYIPQPGNVPEEGEDDVVHTDDDGTKYIVRADKNCYKYEPIKWRVLSVNEDGTDAFVMADKTLDAKAFHSNYSETVTKNNVMWENSDVREWLNETFMETAFSEKEQEAIKATDIDNLRNTYYDGDIETSGEDGEPTQDRIYLASLDDMLKEEYGFINNYVAKENKFLETQARDFEATDFTKSCGDEEGNGYAYNYLLRTLGAFEGYVLSVEGDGVIPVSQLFGTEVDRKLCGIRPVLHLDLTKLETWEYAGKVKQDKTEIAPDATPVVPTERPTAQPGVTMAPGQTYPKNPVVNAVDLEENTWDCIYFGNYYNTKITPSVLASSEDNHTMQTDEEENKYLVYRDHGYFQYEPIKWRVLSINEDGTDAFVMADQSLDAIQYYRDGFVEITWEKSDARMWLNDTFMKTAFTESEIDAIKETTVTTADNQWSGEAGGNDTSDKIYLPSIEEMLESSYGFSNDKDEGATRNFTTTDYARCEVEQDGGTSNAYDRYWLRSQGSKAAHPARIGTFWGFDGAMDVLPGEGNSTSRYGIRPVMHVDLSDTTLWTYAGQVTPKGVVVPKEESSEEPTQAPDTTQPTQKPQTTQPTQKPQTTEPEVKKPGKPKIKNLKNKKGKKVTVTLSKKISGATGYQVAYATKSSMKGQKTKSFKGTSVTIKSLKKKKTYYFRVRAYTKKNGQTVYGSWGNKKKIKIKK